jgi:hypothetical protein
MHGQAALAKHYQHTIANGSYHTTHHKAAAETSSPPPFCTHLALDLRPMC